MTLLKQNTETEVARRKSNFAGFRAKQAVNSQLLLPVAVGKERQQGASQFCQNTRRDRAESYFERYCRKGSSPWFREINVNRMRAGHKPKQMW
jgi:hypothetical protein